MPDPTAVGRRLHRSLAPALLAVSLLGAATACSGAEATGAVTATIVDPPFTVPATDLTDTAGQSFSLTSDTDKRLTLVFFGYTHCPDVCQIVMTTLASAMTRLAPADRDQVDVVFVTTDPARDTSAVLKTYLDRIDPTFIGLTGDLSTITSIGKAMGIGIDQGTKLGSGGYDVSHTTSVLGIDSDDQAPLVWDQTTSSAQFAADIHTLLGKPN